MSLSTTTQWEIRAGGGSDANGGGFFNRVPGTSVDYTQQATAQLSPADLACANSTTVTSAAGGFTAAMAGNVLQITAGANFTPGFYEVVAFTNANTVVLDRIPVAASTTGSAGVGAIGGALATLAKAFSSNRAGNTFWVQKGAGALGITAPLSPPGGGSALPTSVVGYNASRGDGDAVADYSNCPTIRAMAGFPTSGATSGVVAAASSYVLFRSLILDANNIAACGLTTSGGTIVRADNVKAINWTSKGFQFTANGRARRCLATQGVPGATAGFWADSTNTSSFSECVATANPCTGFWMNSLGVDLLDCFSIGNTGASSHGVFLGSQGGIVRGNTIVGNGGNGIHINNYGLDYGDVMRNILANNAGFGIASTGQSYLGVPMQCDYNAFYNNTAGVRSYVPAGPHDLTPTADPFVDASGGNYSPNSSTAGGALLRGLGGPPSVFGLINTTNAVSPGAVQVAATSVGAAGGMSKSRTIEGM